MKLVDEGIISNVAHFLLCCNFPCICLQCVLHTNSINLTMLGHDIKMPVCYIAVVPTSVMFFAHCIKMTWKYLKTSLNVFFWYNHGALIVTGFLTISLQSKVLKCDHFLPSKKYQQPRQIKIRKFKNINYDESYNKFCQ